MSDDRKAVLTQVFTEVLEQLAFMFAEPPEDSSPDLGENGIVQASMGFHGPFNGEIDLVVPRGMCEELAANVLGLDPEDEMVVRAPFDALKELLNVTCGNVLTTLAGDVPIFDLTIPEIKELDVEEWEPLEQRPGSVYYVVDDFPILLYLQTEGTS
jgi:CheY-specific phosphatase CheX